MSMPSNAAACPRSTADDTGRESSSTLRDDMGDLTSITGFNGLIDRRPAKGVVEDAARKDTSLEKLKEEPRQIVDQEKLGYFRGAGVTTSTSELEKEVQTANDAEPLVLDYPESGARAYLTVLGGFLAMISSFGFSNAIGALQAHWQVNQLKEYSPSDISWIGSTALCFLFWISLPNGLLFDAGWFRYQMAIGSILNLVGMFTLSVSKTYYQIYLSYVLAVGIGGGIVFGPIVSCIGCYFLKKRGVMIGLASCGAASGAVLFPLLLNNLFPKIGYGKSVRAAAYLQLGCFALANVLMQPRQLPRRKRPPTIPLLWKFLHEKGTWLVCGGCGLTLLGMFIPLFFFQEFLQVHDLPQWLIDYGLSILQSTAVLARVVTGITCDRWGKVTNAVPIAIVMGLMIYTMTAATSTAGAIAWALVFGFVQGSWITSQTPSIMALSKNVNEIGTRTGLGFLFLGFSVLIGSPVSGALLTKAGGYWGPCVFGGTAALSGGVMLGVARRDLVKKAGTWRV